MRRLTLVALAGLAGCAWVETSFRCDEEATPYKLPVTVYETSCYGTLGMTCTMRPRTEYRETRLSREVFGHCMTRARAEREASARPARPARPIGPLPPPSAANAEGWRLAGPAVLRAAPQPTAAAVARLSAGQAVRPLEGIRDFWIRVALPDGSAGYLPAGQIVQDDPPA